MHRSRLEPEALVAVVCSTEVTFGFTCCTERRPRRRSVLSHGYGRRVGRDKLALGFGYKWIRVAKVTDFTVCDEHM